MPVYYKCSARHKAEVEAPYHELTRGGHIFYVEIDGDATHNPEVIMRVVDMMDQYNIGYGSVNHNRNRCLECGHENSTPNLEECPKCGSKHIDKLQRITGYLVEMLRAGCFRQLMDVQCFDLDAVASIRDLSLIHI